MDSLPSGSPSDSSAFLQMLNEIIENDQKQQQDGFVNVAPIAFWTRILATYFLHVNNPHHDDLLFYVKRPENQEAQAEIEVYRRESAKSPGLGDPAYDWTETVYLNLILQQLEYTLTCAICSKVDSGKQDLIIHKQVSQQVYASPSRHSMDEKGKGAELCYPNIFFTVDNFDEIWTDLFLEDGKMVCVEIVAKDKTENFRSVIFLGSVSHSTLLKVYDNKVKQANKWTQVMSLGLAKSTSGTVFVRMKGPSGKGYAEMALRKANADDLKSQTEQCTCAAASQSTSSCRVHSLSSAQSDPTLYVARKGQANSDMLPLNKRTKRVGKAANLDVSQSLPTTPTSERPLSDLLKTHLTYVSLPWHKIILDVLQAFEKPAFAKKPVLHKTAAVS